MATCERIKAHLNDFLDGTLAAPQAQELNAHLEECASCRTEYRALKATQELVRGMIVPRSEAAQRRVMTRFRQAVATDTGRLPKPTPVPGIFWPTRLLPWGAAGAMAGLLCLLVLLPRLHSNHAGSNAAAGAVIIATAACNPDLPTANDLDQMTSAHAVQSFTLQNGNEEMQQEALADANSRLSSPRIR